MRRFLAGGKSLNGSGRSNNTKPPEYILTEVHQWFEFLYQVAPPCHERRGAP